MSSTALPASPRKFEMFIDSRRTGGDGRWTTRFSPAHGVAVASWPDGTADDARRAIAAARRAFDGGPWRSMSGAQRAEAIHAVAMSIQRHGEELAEIECLETGKPLKQARAEMSVAAHAWRFAAGAARTLHGDCFNGLGDGLFAVVLRQPIGVVGVITPWNFPFVILAERLPFILAAGCTAVVKPSEFTSGTTLRLCDLLNEAGIPSGVINVVTGRGDTVGQAIIDSADVDMVSFTGSTAIGRQVLAASAPHVRKVGLELGGKNPHLVFEDADLDEAADGVAFGMCFNAGQCCVSASRILVHRGVADAFSRKLLDKLASVRVGDPLDERTQVGALFTEAHLDKVIHAIASAQAEGARLACGGHRTGPASGFFVAPTLLTGVTRHMALAREEIFGPVAALTSFHSLDEAIREANASDYGLSASFWTRDLTTAIRAMRQVDAGRIWINTTIDGGPETPIGGMKRSGLGRDAGVAGIEEYTETKTAHIRLQPAARWVA